MNPPHAITFTDSILTIRCLLILNLSFLILLRNFCSLKRLSIFHNLYWNARHFYHNHQDFCQRFFNKQEASLSFHSSNNGMIDMQTDK